MKKCNIIDDLSIAMLNDDRSNEEILHSIKELTDINQKGRDGRTLLIHSVLYNRMEIFKWLLSNGANIQEKDSQGLSALHAAVISKNLAAIDVLLDNGADINQKDNIGNSPLFRAGLNEVIIKKLVEHGADFTLENNYGRSPLNIYEAYPDILAIFREKQTRGRDI